MKNLAYPLTIDGAGRPVTTTDPQQVIRDRITILLNTMPGERPGDLDYGVDYTDIFFSTIEDVEALVEQKVQQALLTYMPDVTLISLDAVVDPNTESRVILNLTFTTSDNQEQTMSTQIDLT